MVNRRTRELGWVANTVTGQRLRAVGENPMVNRRTRELGWVANTVTGQRLGIGRKCTLQSGCARFGHTNMKNSVH